MITKDLTYRNEIKDLLLNNGFYLMYNGEALLLQGLVATGDVYSCTYGTVMHYWADDTIDISCNRHSKRFIKPSLEKIEGILSIMNKITKAEDEFNNL